MLINSIAVLSRTAVKASRLQEKQNGERQARASRVGMAAARQYCVLRKPISPACVRQVQRGEMLERSSLVCDSFARSAFVQLKSRTERQARRAKPVRPQCSAKTNLIRCTNRAWQLDWQLRCSSERGHMHSMNAFAGCGERARGRWPDLDSASYRAGIYLARVGRLRFGRC